MSIHLRNATAGICIVAQAMATVAMAQQNSSTPPASSAPSRPTSDFASPRPAGTAGTTYLQRPAGATTDLASSLTSGIPVVGSDEQVHVVAPTSDRSNIPRAAFINELSANANPAAIDTRKLKAYTTYKFLRKPGAKPAAATAAPAGESPASMRQVYGVGTSSGAGVIAIVDAFSYPEADADLALFSATFKLPACRENKANERAGCLQKFPQDGSGREAVAGTPVNCGWVGEAALDLQWAHAIAPGAKIVFVQAKSDSIDDLYAAVKIAVSAVKSAGGGEVSMSWSSEEWPSEVSEDSIFAPGALYFASSGDVGGAMGFPAASPYVISVGGTGLLRDGAGKFLGEYGWTGSGGGQSQFEATPPYQVGVENIVGSHRNVPDISADSDPNTGAAVYMSTPVSHCADKPTPDQYRVGWQVIGGTSLASPMIAAMVNVAGHHRSSVAAELTAIYANRKNGSRIRDVTVMNGTAGGNAVKAGYDNVTGVGSPSSVDFDADPATTTSPPH